MNTVDNLRAGAKVVRQQGLTKHMRQDNLGRVCFLGALDIVTGRMSDHLLESTALVMSLGLPHDGRIPSWQAADWNNRLESTTESVATAMEFAALYWEEKHKQQKAQPQEPPVPLPQPVEEDEEELATV